MSLPWYSLIWTQQQDNILFLHWKHSDSRHFSWTKCSGHIEGQAFCTLLSGGQRLQLIRLLRPLHSVMIISQSSVFGRTRRTHKQLQSSAMLLWPPCSLPAGGHVSCLAYPCSFSQQQLLSLTLFGWVFSLYLLSPGGIAPAITPPPPHTWSPALGCASAH